MLARLILITTLMLCTLTGSSQRRHSSYPIGVVVLGGDTLVAYQMPYVTVRSTAIGRRAHRRVKKRNKLRYNVYKVYPYVLSMTDLLDEVDSAYTILGDTKKFSEYKKQKEKSLIAQYKPVVKNMTYSQGKVIVLLINRESGRPCYDVIKQLRGGVQAVFWQGVARLFDNNLKRTYEPDHRDKEVEDIVQDILAGVPY